MSKIRLRLPGSNLRKSNLAVFVYQNEKKALGSYVLGPHIHKWLTAVREEGFEAKLGEVALFRPHPNHSQRVLFVGLGPQKESSVSVVQNAAAAAIRGAIKFKFSSISLRPPLSGKIPLASQAAVEGIRLGLYKYTTYKSKPSKKISLDIDLLLKNISEKKEFENGIKQGEIFADATILARDLINQGPSDATPQALVQEARKIAKKGIKLRVFGKAQLNKMGMGGILGVNRGSSKPPAFLHFIYKSKSRAKRRIGLCGKGITFDSGGLSLKPSKSMETMKMDMSGAAAVFAVFKALGQIRPNNIEVHGFTPLTENMPGANAQKPGDILKTFGGKTVEVLNTDAEGRLVLADALGYASKQPLDEIIDIATLTGAAIVALGSNITAVMGTDKALIEKLIKSGEKSGEKIWELPLENGYKAHMDSPIADIKNIGKGEAGTIIGGLFLKEFVTNNKPWAHLDIAGPAWTNDPTILSQPGGTGVMVRTLLNHILSYT